MLYTQQVVYWKEYSAAEMLICSHFYLYFLKQMKGVCVSPKQLSSIIISEHCKRKMCNLATEQQMFVDGVPVVWMK